MRHTSLLSCAFRHCQSSFKRAVRARFLHVSMLSAIPQVKPSLALRRIPVRIEAFDRKRG